MVTLTIDGVDVVDAMATQGHQFVIENIHGRDLVEDELQTVERHGSTGSRLIESRSPAREIAVAYALVSSNATERRLAGQHLGRLMRGSGLRQVEFSDQDGYYLASPRNTEGEQWPRFGRGDLIFYCPQPYLYGSEQTVTPTNGTVAIESNTYVEPVILWETSSQVGAAWIEVDGQRLTIDTGISSGQQIRIDCTRKEVRVGGVLNVENIHGVYPRVYDGSTVSTSPGGEISFSYQERWI